MSNWNQFCLVGKKSNRVQLGVKKVHLNPIVSNWFCANSQSWKNSNWKTELEILVRGLRCYRFSKMSEIISKINFSLSHIGLNTNGPNGFWLFSCEQHNEISWNFQRLVFITNILVLSKDYLRWHHVKFSIEWLQLHVSISKENAGIWEMLSAKSRLLEDLREDWMLEDWCVEVFSSSMDAFTVYRHIWLKKALTNLKGRYNYGNDHNEKQMQTT